MSAPGTNGIPWLDMERPEKAHVVAAIHFAPKSNDGPCDCSCGESMLASEFSQHRRDVGLKSGIARSMGEPSVWDRSEVCKVYGCGRPKHKLGFCAGHLTRHYKGTEMETPLGPSRGVNRYGRSGIAGTRLVAGND